MHIPFLKGLVGYQQPPSLGMQGSGEDMGVWVLPVPSLVPMTPKCPCWCRVSCEAGHTLEVLVPMCCTLQCCPTGCSAVAQGSLWGGCCAQMGWTCDAFSVRQVLTADSCSTRFLPCPLLSIFVFSLDFSSSYFLLCFKSLSFVCHWLLLNPSEGWLLL